MAPFHLLPRDERFFGMFGDSARNVAAGVVALSDLLSSYTNVDVKVHCIKELEHVGDQLTHAIFDALNRAFVTPFDREDIARLGRRVGRRARPSGRGCAAFPHLQD